MSEQELVDVLSVHADSLKDGVDLTDELLAARHNGAEQELESLLLLARQVKEALAPVAPRLDFVTTLKAELRADARRTVHAKTQRSEVKKRQWVGLAAGLGALVYFVGLTWVSLKWSIAVLGFLAGLIGLRSVRQAPTKTRPA